MKKTHKKLHMAMVLDIILMVIILLFVLSIGIWVLVKYILEEGKGEHWVIFLLSILVAIPFLAIIYHSFTKKMLDLKSPSETASGKVYKKTYNADANSYYITLSSSKDTFKISPEDYVSRFQISREEYERIVEGDSITITYHPESKTVEGIKLGLASADVASDLEALADLYEAQGKHAEAKRLRRQAAEKRQELKRT